MKHYFLHIALSLALLFGLVLVVQAEADDLTEEEIVVTATRTEQSESQAPGMNQVITKEEITDSGAKTVAEAMLREGQTITTFGGEFGTASAQIDGSGTQRTLVLINGIAANSGIGGIVDLGYFPTTSIEKIEVAHGPLSALYGANAIGGAVNIITDLTGKPRNELNLTGGSFGLKSFDSTLKQEKWGLTFGGSTSDGHRDHSQTDKTFLMGQYDIYGAGQDSLSLYWQYLNKTYDSPGSTSWVTPNDYGSEENSSISLNGKKRLWGGLWEYKFFSQNLLYKYHDDFGYYQHQTAISGLDLAGEYNFKANQLLTGLMLKMDRYDSNTIGEHTPRNGAVFIQDTWQITKKWLLTSGFRWDTGADYSSPITPRVYLSNIFNEHLTFKLGYGKAFRAPSYDMLYWTPYNNPDLQPEKGERYDLIADWRKSSQAVSIGLFQTYLTDGIQSDFSTGYVPYNIAKMKIRGVNWQWDGSWNKLVNTNLNYSWVDSRGWDELTQSYSKDLNDLGKGQLTIGLNLKKHSWTTGVEWKGIRDRNNDQPDYDLLNLYLGYRLNHNVQFNLTVLNVNDEYYQVKKDYPMPGREYRFNSSYSF